MSFNYNNLNSGIPAGSIIATLATTDPPGWVIADGVVRPNTNNMYATLGSMNIGSLGDFGIDSYTVYYPPNLKGACLRATGTNTFNNITYNGQTFNTYDSDKFQKHSHPATQVDHTHTNNTTNAKDMTQDAGAKGIAVQNGTNTNGNSLDNSVGEINLDTISNFTLNSIAPIITVNSTGGDDTSPFCFGVNWAIKI
jgi:hypothetical protein